MKPNPASSAVRATVARSAPSRAGPPGVVKSGICKPICTPIASAVGVSGADSHSLLPPVTPGLIRVPHNGVMTQPVIKTRTLVTDDGVQIEAMHLPKGGDLAILLAHHSSPSRHPAALSCLP